VRHPRGGVGAGGRLPRRVQRHEVRADPAGRVRAHARDELPRCAAVPGGLARTRAGVARAAMAPREGDRDLPDRDVGALVLRADPRRPDPGDLVEAPAAGDPRAAAGDRVRRRDARRRWRLTAGPRRGSGEKRGTWWAPSAAQWA